MSKKRQRLSIQENALNVEKKAKLNAMSLLETCIGRYNVDVRSKNAFMTGIFYIHSFYIKKHYNK